MTRVRNPMPDPDNYKAMGAWYRREAERNYRQSAKRQRDAKKYREWARDSLTSARYAHRMNRHDQEQIHRANAVALVRLARQADRFAPKDRERARNDIRQARIYERWAAERQARVDAYLATPAGQEFAKTLRGTD
jgi:hypothetical protein